MKKLLLTAAVAMMAAMNVNAQLSDDTQGVGGLVLDSIYTTNSNGARSMKYIYEYTEAKLPEVEWSLAYFDENNAPIDEPRTVGRDNYFYDEQNRQTKIESYKEVNGELRLSFVEEIVEFDAATGLPSVVYAYTVDEKDPDATPQLVEKVVTTKFHGNMGMEDAEIYLMQNGEWVLGGTVHYEYDEDGRLTSDVMSVVGIEVVTEYEYDAHGHINRKVVRQQTEIAGVMYEISTMEMTFTNEYYDDGNLKTSAEYDEGTLVETGYYFWGNGVTTAIRQMQETVRSFINYYDLQGRRLSNQPMLHGIYVKNGKKIMVR